MTKEVQSTKGNRRLWLVVIVWAMGLAASCMAQGPFTSVLRHWQWGRDLMIGASNEVSGKVWLELPSNVKVVSKSATGNGVANDTAYVQAQLTALTAGDVLDLQGKTYGVNGLTFAVSDVVIRNGTLKCLAAIDEWVAGDGSRVRFEDVTFDGGALACRLLTSAARNTGWTFVRCKFFNGYLDNTFYGANEGTAAGFQFRRGSRGFRFVSCVASNITHLTNGTENSGGRTSAGFVGGIFGWIDATDNLADITFEDCWTYKIGPQREGDGIRVQNTAGVDTRLVITGGGDIDFGRSGVKAICKGSKVTGRTTYSLDTNAIAGIRIYGSTPTVTGCTVEVEGNGIYLSGYQETIVGAVLAGNTITIGTTNSASSGYAGYYVQGFVTSPSITGGSVTRGYNGMRLEGAVYGLVASGITFSNQTSIVIRSHDDGTNSPSKCVIGPGTVENPASYIARIEDGTNITVFGMNSGALGTAVTWDAGATGEGWGNGGDATFGGGANANNDFKFRSVNDNYFWRIKPRNNTTDSVEFYGPFNQKYMVVRNTSTSLDFTSPIQVGSGAAITSILSATATLDFPSVASLGQQDLTVTVTGAATGNAVQVGLPAAPTSGIAWSAWVSAADTVTVRAHNYTAGAVDPASASYRVTVTKY